MKEFIPVECSVCHRKYQAPLNYAGKVFACHCGQNIEVPETESKSSLAPVPEKNSEKQPEKASKTRYSKPAAKPNATKEIRIPGEGDRPSGLTARLILGVAAVGCFFVFLLFVPKPKSDTKAYLNEMNGSIPELAYARGTLYSHVLLPDARLSIRAFDTKAHAADLARIKTLFPKETERAAILAWGRELFESVKIGYQKDYQFTMKAGDNYLVTTSVPKDTAKKKMEAFMALEVDDALAAHVAWRRIIAAPWVSDKAISSLINTISTAIPDAGERKRLLDWAETRRTRRGLERHFIVNEKLVKHRVRPIPPKLPWIQNWILLEEWCPTPETFAGRKADLLERFGDAGSESRWRNLLRLGKSILEERAKEPDSALPNQSEQAQMIAVVDRFSGLDPSYAPRAAKAAANTLKSEPHNLLDLSTQVHARVTPAFVINYDDWELVHENGLEESINGFNGYRVEDLYSDEKPGPIFQPNDDSGGAFMLLWILAFGVLWMGYGLAVFVAVDLPGILLGLWSNPAYRTLVADLQNRSFLNIGVLAVAGVLGEITGSWFYDPLRLVLKPEAGAMPVGQFLKYGLAGLFGFAFDQMLKVIWIRFGNVTFPKGLLVVSFFFGWMLATACGVPSTVAAIGAIVGVLISTFGEKLEIRSAGPPPWSWWIWVPVGFIVAILMGALMFGATPEENRKALASYDKGIWEVKPSEKQPQWWDAK